jgi:hypothetical protein
MFLWDWALTGPLSFLQMTHKRIWSNGGMILTGEIQRTRRKNCPNATSSTTDPKWTVLGAYQGFRGEKPASNRLSYDTAAISEVGTCQI